MTLTIQLTPETEVRLREWANLTGKNPEALALQALDEKLAAESIPLPHDASAAEFERWFAAHPASQTSALDDSREGIYEGRGA